LFIYTYIFNAKPIAITKQSREKNIRQKRKQPKTKALISSKAKTPLNKQEAQMRADKISQVVLNVFRFI
jgi:hypothetical protein